MTVPLARWLSYVFALSAHYSGLDRLYRRLSGGGLVVLMLHRLRRDDDPYPLSTSRECMRQLADWLLADHALVGLDEGLQSLSSTVESGVRYSITFDDGYRDNLRLIEPDLADIPAVIYLATGHIGGEPIWVYRLTHAVESRTRDHLDLGDLGLGHFDLSDAGERERLYALLPPRLKQFTPEGVEQSVDLVTGQLHPLELPAERADMLGWDDVRQLAEHGIGIGGHTRYHVLLSRVDAATAKEEIDESRAQIATEIGMPPRHFAYPNGTAADFGERDIQLVRDAGYHTAVTSIEGINRRGADPFRLLRYNVHEWRYRTPRGRLSKALFFSETSGLLGWLRSRRVA